MASIINSLRNLSSDSFWFIKILFLATPIFFILEYGALESYSFEDKLIFGSIIGIVYLGVVAILMYRNINNLSPILPSFFSIPELIIKALGISVVSVPLYIIYICIINAIATQLTFEPFVMWVIYICVTLFIAPFIFVPAVLYCVRGKISDAFNFKIIVDAAGNFSVAFLSYVIQYAFSILLFTYLFYRMFDAMVESSMVSNIIFSISFVISFLSLYSYCSDCYGDIIPQIKKKKKNKINCREDILDW